MASKKEKQNEEKELDEAVRVLGAAISAIASRKARRYEQELLRRVRDMIDVQLEVKTDVEQYSAEHMAQEIKREVTK